MKKRLKGLLAFWLCVILLVGGSMTAMAADYDFGNLGQGSVLVGKDNVKFEGSGGTVSYCIDGELNDKQTIGAYGTASIKDGNWKISNIDGWDLYLELVQSSSAEVQKETTSSYICEHDMGYEIYLEPTEEVDGLWAYQCGKCEHIDHFLPISGMGAFFKRAITTINGAAENGAVTVATDKWMSFNKNVYDALAARPDVTLTVNYKYKGTFYSVTIPAGTDMTPYLTEDGYCGFLYLASLFGATEISE